MGMDISGGMLVGCHGSRFQVSKDCPEEYYSIFLEDGEELKDLEYYELVEGFGMERYCEYYDADFGHSSVGFFIPDIEVRSEGFAAWLNNVHELALKFQEITGVKAQLIGCQSVW